MLPWDGWQPGGSRRSAHAWKNAGRWPRADGTSPAAHATRLTYANSPLVGLRLTVEPHSPAIQLVPRMNRLASCLMVCVSQEQLWQVSIELSEFSPLPVVGLV